MNSVIFMPSVMSHCGGGGGDVEGFLTMILTFLIVGIILIILGIFANILHVKFSRGFDGTTISWADIKPDIDNTFLGCLGGVLGVIFICASTIIGIVAGVYWVIVTLI